MKKLLAALRRYNILHLYDSKSSNIIRSSGKN